MAVVTTSAAVAGAVAANNAANQSRKDKQKVEKCKLVIDDFDSNTADTQQMQQYAECVQLVYPESGADSPTFATTVIILSIIVTVGCVTFDALREILHT